MSCFCPLILNLQVMYPHYKFFQMVPIVIGALVYVPKCLEMYIHQLGFKSVKSTFSIAFCFFTSFLLSFVDEVFCWNFLVMY